MYRYQVKLSSDSNGTFLVTFPDVPEAITFGETKEEALLHAAEALEAALSIYMDDRKDVPVPKTGWKRGTFVRLPVLSASKVALYQGMRASGITKAELGRRLKLHPPQVDRLLDLNHASRLNQLEQAFLALGKRLTVSLEDAA